MTDIELGYQHGRCGLAAAYPNNANYMIGFVAGHNALMRELHAARPIETMEPGGINEANIDDQGEFCHFDNFYD